MYIFKLGPWCGRSGRTIARMFMWKIGRAPEVWFSPAVALSHFSNPPPSCPPGPKRWGEGPMPPFPYPTPQRPG